MEIKQFKPKDHFVRCTIYGGSWVGKTVFGGTAPKPIFASSEKGLLSIVSTLGYHPDYVNIESIKDLQELYKHLKKTNTYQTLVLDSLTEINEIIKEGIEQRTGKQMTRNERWELSRKIKDIIRSFKDLEMHVIVICQEKHNTNDEWVTEAIYPMLNGKNATEIAYMMDIVGYMYIDKDGDRHITTAPNQKLLSKDRSGQIGRDAPLDFKEWVGRILKQDEKMRVSMSLWTVFGSRVVIIYHIVDWKVLFSHMQGRHDYDHSMHISLDMDLHVISWSKVLDFVPFRNSWDIVVS